MKNTNLFWAGLATLAAKRFDRDLLTVGDHELAYRISDASKHVEKVSGVLTVSPSQVRSAINKPASDELLAATLYRLGPRKRREIAEVLAEDGLIADDASTQLARELIKRLSVTTTNSVRGSVAFRPD